MALLRQLSAEQLLRAFEDLGPTATISDRFPNLSGVELHNVVPSSCPAGLSESFVPAYVARQFASFLESGVARPPHVKCPGRGGLFGCPCNQAASRAESH